MAAAVACPRFSQNAWRRELCANCFKAKTEHAVVAPRPAPSRFAKPKKSILKGISDHSKPARTVCFPAEESEVIGYDGGDVSSDDEEPSSTPLTNGTDTVDSPLYPEMSEEEDKDLQNVTRRNTDFNSENANLLIDKAPPPLPKSKQKENNNKTTATPITINCTPFSPNTKASNIPKSINNNKTNEAPKKTTIEIGKRNGTTPLVSVTPFGGTRIDVKAKNDVNTASQESRIPRPSATERRPPLGHEASAPLTAPALVKLTTTSPPPPPKPDPPQEKPPEVIFASDSSSSEDSLEAPVFSRNMNNVECEPPAFLRHKDSVDLMSPPQSPRLPGKTEERPAPIGKVSSTLTVLLKSPTSPPKESKRAPKLVEARSSALIRRWTVGERVLIQPRRPVLDAPEIVPLALQSSKSTLGLEPRELAGQPDGEDSTTTSEPMTSNNTILSTNEKPSSETQLIKQDDKPPTPPSSPLPEDEVDKPPMLPNSPPPTLTSHQKSILHDLATCERPNSYNLIPQVNVATMERPTSLNLTAQVNVATEEIISTEVIGKLATLERPKSVNIKEKKSSKSRPKSMHQERAVDVPIQERPKSLNLATPPVPKSQDAPAVTPRSSFLHGAMLGRPQVPAKPASLLASVPAKAASLLATSKRFLNSSTSAIAVSTPQPPTLESPTNKSEEKSKILIKKEDISLPCTPENKPESTIIYETPKNITTDIDMSLKPPFSTPKPKLGSYKKRQAPKPPTPLEEEKTHTRNSSQDSFDELTRRDSITSLEKSPPTKKNNARFSLRRLLRLGKDERAMSPESPSSPTSSPSPPGSPPIRPEIIHPSMLDGKEVQVVSRIQQSSSPTTPPPQNLSSTSPTTPAGRPRPPPPPPRTLSLSGSTGSSGLAPRPSRPPPPQSAQLLDMREKATDPSDRSNDDDAVYANLDLVKSRVAHGAGKTTPNSNLRETSPEPLSSPTSDDTDYETIQFSDGRMSRRRRSAVSCTLEENYGAVVGANHRALAQLVTSLCNLPLPANHSTTSLSDYTSLANKEEDKNLVLLQILVTLRGLQETGVMNVGLEEFAVITFSAPQLTEIGPRLQHDSNKESHTRESLQDVAHQMSQSLLPDDTKLTSILINKGLNKCISYLEFKIWGPELSPQDKEIAIQRWLDLERATALQNLAQNRTSTKLPVSQELYLNFLIASSAIGLSRASLL